MLGAGASQSPTFVSSLEDLRSDLCRRLLIYWVRACVLDPDSSEFIYVIPSLFVVA